MAMPAVSRRLGRPVFFNTGRQATLFALGWAPLPGTQWPNGVRNTERRRRSKMLHHCWWSQH